MRKAINAIKGFFLAIGGKILSAIRQILRFFLFPFAHRRRKHPEKAKDGLMDRLIAWSEIGEPEDPEEKAMLFLSRWYSLFTFLWVAAIAGICILIFGLPFHRAQSSFIYIGESWSYIFQYFASGGEGGEIDIPIPEVSNQSAAEFEWVLSTLKSFWFYLQAGIGGMTNKYVAMEWWYSLSEKVLNLTKILTWIPIGIIMAKIFASILVSPHESDDGESTFALRWWDEKLVPNVLRPIRDRARDYGGWLSAYSSKVKKILLVITAVLCVYGWTFLDFVTSYFLMLITFSFGWFPAFGASVIIDFINIVLRLGIPGFLAFLFWWIYKSNVSAALGELRSMQGNNEDIASSLPVVTAINGPVGVGKTTMVSSIATDAEASFRDYYLSVITKYAAAFPKFDWEKLEDWVRKKSDKQEANRLETRAKLKEGLKALWIQWSKAGYPFELENGNEAFFGYDVEFGKTYFDGAKVIYLIDAVMAYAESYFMYFSGKKLVTSNYPIAIDDGGYGQFFRIYSPASSYLAKGCRIPQMKKAYSSIFNEDFFRIKNAMDPGDRSKDAAIDGGVIAMTEGSNERGNKNDYVGISRKDEKANKVNDGWNQAMRLIRHWFMVDMKPVCCFLYDYQRGDAMNADQRDAAEDTIFIMERGEEQNALPGWWFLDFLTEWVQARWNNYYWYSWRAYRRKRTLLNRFLGRVAGFFINLRQRLRYSYGYEAVVFNREHGGGNGLTGQRTMEQYFFIYRKVRGELFNSGVYAPILEQRSISAKSGWLDVDTFQSTEAMPEEFAKEKSFFIKEISSLFDPKEAERASMKIQMNASEGTTLWEEEPEEEPKETPEGSEEDPAEETDEGEDGTDAS